MTQLTSLLAIVIAIATTTPAAAAGPITHVVLVEQWMDHHEDYSDQQRRELLLGTLFPDIRYLAGSSCMESYPPLLSTQDLASLLPPFNRGTALHTFIDVNRSRLIKEWNIYEELLELSPDLPEDHLEIFLKLVEDEILFDEKDWTHVLSDLTDPADGELAYGLPIQHIVSWHAVLTSYFSMRPSRLITMLALGGQGLFGVPPEIIATWQRLIPLYAANEELRDYVADLVSEFDRVFSN